MGGVMMSIRIPPGGTSYLRSLISAGPYRSRLPRRHSTPAFHDIPKPE